MVKNTPLHQLRKCTGKRETHKTWLSPTVYPEYQETFSTRKGREILRAIEFKQKQERKGRLYLSNMI